MEGPPLSLKGDLLFVCLPFSRTRVKSSYLFFSPPLWPRRNRHGYLLFEITMREGIMDIQLMQGPTTATSKHLYKLIQLHED